MLGASFTAKNGDKVDVQQAKTAKVANFLWSRTQKGTEYTKNIHNFDISVGGKKVGDAQFMMEGDAMHLGWLGIDQNHRGKGYASAVFGAAVELGKANGAKRLTLEVPGRSPDARHIYEKHGFVVDPGSEYHDPNPEGYWGGLTAMSLDLSSVPITHSDLPEEEELELAIMQTFPQDTHPVDDILEHFGVIGMKWGKHKAGVEAAPASKDAQEAKSFRSAGVHSLSNDELRKLNQRTQLETDYARLNPSKLKKGKAVVAEVLIAAATIRTVYNYVNSPMGKAVRAGIEGTVRKVMGAATE